MTSSSPRGFRGIVPLRKQAVSLLVLAVLFSFIITYTFAQVPGADILSNSTTTKTPSAAEYLNTSGGSFTTIILSSENQNLKWKAYAGNVTGVLTLDDSGNYSIFRWTITTYTGEVFASRNSSVAWSSVRCANTTNIRNEEIRLNHSLGVKDNINSTFNYQIHKEFYVASTKLTQSTCKSAFTWANNTAQTPSVTSPYQEVVLWDTRGLIFTTFINDGAEGFNFNNYDFQMILPEKGVGGYPNTRYYFYMELQ